MKTVKDMREPAAFDIDKGRFLRRSIIALLALLFGLQVAFVIDSLLNDSGFDEGAVSRTLPADVVFELVNFDHWLRLNPNAELVGQYMDSSNPAYAETVAGQRQLASGELRYDPPHQRLPVRSVGMEYFPTDIDAGEVVHVPVTFASFPAQRIVGRDGQVVYDVPERPGATVIWDLRWNGTNWLLLGVGE